MIGSNRDEALRILEDAIDADAQWLSNRKIRDACYEAIALLVDAPEYVQQRDLLRRALVGLVGADGMEELSQMEAVMRAMPAPAEDKAKTIDAIHALAATIPTKESR